MSLPAMPMSPMGGYGDGSVYGYSVGSHMGHAVPAMSPMGMAPMGHPMLPQPGPLHRTDSTSEFNAAAFDGMLAASLRTGPGSPGADVTDGPTAAAPGRAGRLSKAQSLVDLSRAGSSSRLGDYWRVESVTAPSRPVAYMVPSTRSLDRRLHRPRRAVSMADLGVHGVHAPAFVHAAHFPPQPVFFRDAYGREFVYPSPYVHPSMLYRGATSKTSLGAASDDFRKYRDVAL